MAAQQQGGGGGSDNSLGFLWIIIGAFIAFALIWHFFSPQILAVILRVKLAEVEVIQWITSSAAWIKQWINQAIAAPQDVSFDELAIVSTAIGKYLRIPFAALLFIFAFLVYRSDIRAKFKKTYSVKTLIQHEQDNWPQIKPVAELDLINTDIDDGEWAMALTPKQLAWKYKLVYLKDLDVIPAGTLQKDIQPEVVLDKEKAAELFVRQLGRQWTRVEDLPIHAKALFAVFAARINRERDAAHEMLSQMSDSAALGKVDFTGVDELLEKFAHTKLVEKVVSKHAYITTVMSAILETARDDGVVASADFLWLKPYDRKLWYVLNVIGRRTVYPEVAGAYCHWIAEKALGRKLKLPMMQEAVVGMEQAIKGYKFTDDEIAEIAKFSKKR